MPKRKVNASLVPRHVEARVLAQMRDIYAGAKSPKQSEAADTSCRAYMYEGTDRAPPRARTRKLSPKERGALVKQHEAAVLAGDLDPDEYIFHDQQHWPPREILLKRRKVGGRLQWVYRIKGQVGADLKVDPSYWELLKKQRDFEAECAKAHRAINTLLRNKRSKGNAAAEQRHALIVTMVESLKHLPPRNRASVAAGKLGISVRTVRNALQKSGKSRK